MANGNGQEAMQLDPVLSCVARTCQTRSDLASYYVASSTHQLLSAILQGSVAAYAARVADIARDWRQALAALTTYVAGDQFSAQCGLHASHCWLLSCADANCRTLVDPCPVPSLLWPG